jgi:hypothetical protein
MFAGKVRCSPQGLTENIRMTYKGCKGQTF